MLKIIPYSPELYALVGTKNLRFNCGKVIHINLTVHIETKTSFSFITKSPGRRALTTVDIDKETGRAKTNNEWRLEYVAHTDI